MISRAISNRAGQYIRQRKGYKAFFPKPLPPSDPPLEFAGELSVRGLRLQAPSVIMMSGYSVSG